MNPHSATFTLALALAAGVFAQSLARQLRIPGIILLLAIGAALGPEGFGWIDPEALGEGLFGLVEFGVAVILFEGGMNLEISRLRRQEAPIRRLVTVGAVVTLLGGTLAARFLLDWSWSLSTLFGSLVVVTGPTVVTPLLRELRLRPGIRTVLEAEGVLIDPIGAILAVLVLEIVLAPGAIAAEFAQLLLRLGFGTLAGVAAGFAVGGLLRVRGLVPEGFANILTLAGVVLLFQGCDALVAQSGIVAVTVAGIVVGNMDTPVDRDLREFKDQLTVMLVGLIFVLLAAGIRLEDIRTLGPAGGLVIAALVLVVRPIGVWLSTQGSRLAWRERAFVAWIAPRGIVAAAVASLTSSALTNAGVTGGVELRAIVFLTIATTVVLAGATALPLATLLRLRMPGRDRVAILGAEGLGLALGHELRRADIPVVFLDADPRHCREAEEAGFPVVFGDALSERTLQRAQLELVGTAVGATPNDHLNSLFVGQARDLFDVPQTLVAVNALVSEWLPGHLERQAGAILFDGPHDLERWAVRWRHGATVVETFVYAPPVALASDGAPPAQPGTIERRQAGRSDRFVPLVIRRGRRTTPMTLGFEPRAGDAAAVAIYAPERDEAVAELRSLGWNAGEGPTDPNMKPPLARPRRSPPESVAPPNKQTSS